MGSGISTIAHSTEPSFLSWLGSIISDIAPIIALIGAIFVFYLQRKHDQERETVAEKRLVYRDFILVTKELIGYYASQTDDEVEIPVELAQKAWDCFGLLALYAPEGITDYSRKVVLSALNPSDEKEVWVTDLVRAMKSDLQNKKWSFEE